MEIRLAAKVYQVCFIRAIRHVMLKHIIRNRLAPVKDNVTQTDDSLFVLSVAHLLEPERAALGNRDFVMLVRPRAIYGLVEDKLPVGIDAEIVIIQYVILAEASRIEAYPVILPCQVKLRIGIHPVTQQCIAGRKEQAFPIAFTSHRECVMTGFSLKQCLVCRTDATYRIRLDSGHQRADIRKLGDPVPVGIDKTLRRNRCITLRVSLDIHDAVGYASEEITVTVLTGKCQLHSSVHIDHHLFSEVPLGYHPFIYCLLVRLYDKPGTGVGTLVISRAHNE